MANCYLCGIDLESYSDSTTRNHKEHIIPQALGGHLDIEGILCKECGGDKFLSGKVDKPFADLFLFITQSLNIKRDRGSTNPPPLKGWFTPLETGERIDINFKDGLASARKPGYSFDHSNKIIYVVANKKVAKNYQNKAKKDLKEQGKDVSKYSIKIISSFNDVPGMQELPFSHGNHNFNESFAKGLLKIAIEFALSKDIKQEAIAHLIDQEKRELKSVDKDKIITYYPLSKIEANIEKYRPSIDDNYMSHSLVLFSQQVEGRNTKQLYCFIELFGTFQHFVELRYPLIQRGAILILLRFPVARQQKM